MSHRIDEVVVTYVGCQMSYADVAVDDKGFVMTGHDAALPLQTGVPGVYAIGDVRAGSVKRVGGPIGDGAGIVAQIHGYLGRRKETGR